MFKTPAWDDGWPEAFHLARHLIYRCVHNGSLRRGNHKARFGRARGHAETRANARARNQQATPLFGGARPSTIRGSFAFNQDVPVVLIECKGSSYGAGSSTAEQGRGLLVAGARIRPRLGVATGTAETCFVVPSPEATVMDATVDEMTRQVEGFRPAIVPRGSLEHRSPRRRRLYRTRRQQPLQRCCQRSLSLWSRSLMWLTAKIPGHSTSSRGFRMR